MTISEDDLRGLSAIEREALLNDPDEDGEIALQLGAADTPAVPHARDLEYPEAGESEEDGSDAGRHAAADEGGDDDDMRAAQPERATPADIDDQRKELNAWEDESMEKLLDGEISQEEHSKVKNEVRARLDDLLMAQATDRASDVIAHRQMLEAYNVDLKATMKDAKVVGLDYKDAKLGAEFDRAVRMFAGDAAEQGLQDLPGNLAASKFALAEAQALMFRRHGRAAPAAAASVSAAAAAPAVAKERPAPDRSKLGVTLAAMPAASDAAITTEFAHLDGISEPAALERELAKLSPEAQERYLGA